MNITFLGTGTSQGIPLIACECRVCRSLDYRDKRFRCSVLIEVDGLNLVVDSGPDFRQQMLRKGQKTLDALLITHEHKDHVAGLDDVRAFNYFQNRPMPLYSLPRVLDHIRMEFAYAFAENKYPGVPQIDLYEIGEEPFRIGNVEIRPIPVMHARLPILGFRVGDFSYVTDANFLSPEAMEVIRGSKVLVLNALRREKHVSHYTLEQAIVVGKESGVPQIYFTHISHQLGLHDAVSGELPDGFHLAWDGLALTL